MLEKPSPPYSNLSASFAEQNPDYSKQYFNIYITRLKQMTPLLEEQIGKKWGDKYPVYKLHKLSEQKNSKCVVIATVFKNQKLKPSILKLLSDNQKLEVQPIRMEKYTDESDELFIEDEILRYRVIGSLKGLELVTGITCALLGTDDGKGKFISEDHIFAGLRPQIERPLSRNCHSSIVFISGLDLANSDKFQVNLQLFKYWLFGLVDDTQSMARLIIAGNCIRSDPEDVKPSISLLSKRNESSKSIETVKILDSFLNDLCHVIDVDVMPGQHDPTNHVLPQQPMHHCLFPRSRLFKSQHQVTNPYFFEMGGVRMLGTSGQNVGDVFRFSNVDDEVEALESILRWGHLVPTAPDTIGCFPFYFKDPFVLDECPHVLFAGNCNRFGTKIVKGSEGQSVRVICVPEFRKTMEVCVLDLDTLECHTVSFKAG